MRVKVANRQHSVGLLRPGYDHSILSSQIIHLIAESFQCDGFEGAVCSERRVAVKKSTMGVEKANYLISGCLMKAEKKTYLKDLS